MYYISLKSSLFKIPHVILVWCIIATVCLNGDIRLVGGSTANEGRVELCHGSQWGTVCDDGWDDTDAIVACRQAGFSPSSKLIQENDTKYFITYFFPCTDAAATYTAVFGRGMGHILLDEVGCSGSESSLFSCPSGGVGSHNCGHHEDAGVICTGEFPYVLC